MLFTVFRSCSDTGNMQLLSYVKPLHLFVSCLIFLFNDFGGFLENPDTVLHKVYWLILVKLGRTKTIVSSAFSVIFEIVTQYNN